MERFANWSELPAKKQEVLERKLFYGKEMMMVRNEVKPHGVLALHSHPHAQMTMVLAGACDVTMEGETFHLTTDGVVYFPPDVPHEVVNTGETTLILLDVFTPIREDFCHNRKSRRIPFENLSAFVCYKVSAKRMSMAFSSSSSCACQ